MDRRKNFIMDGQTEELCFGWIDRRTFSWMDRRKHFIMDGRTEERRMEVALTAAPHLEGLHARLEAVYGGSDGRGRLR